MREKSEKEGKMRERERNHRARPRRIESSREGNMENWKNEPHPGAKSKNNKSTKNKIKKLKVQSVSEK